MLKLTLNISFFILLFGCGKSLSSAEIRNLHLQAADYYKARNDSEAIKLWQEVVANDSGHIEAWENIAIVQEQELGDKVKAENTLRQAIEKNPKSEELISDLAGLLKRQGRVDDSLGLLNQVLQNSPSFIQALRIRASIYFAIGKNQNALNDWQVVKDQNPKERGINFNLGLVYERLERNKDAIEAFEAETKLSPLNAEAFAKLGDVLNNQGSTNSAIAAYKEAIRIEDGLAWPHYNLGLVLEKKKRYSEAIQSYKTALVLNPELSAARERIEKLQKMLK